MKVVGLLLALVACALAQEPPFVYDTGLDLLDYTFTIPLNGTWTLSSSGEKDLTLPATVPGNVHTDLLAVGLIGDPYFRYNDVNYRWIVQQNWSFSRSFTITAAQFAQQRILLVCEGLDTVASITINGQVVGQTANQFRKFVFEIKSTLNVGVNTITIDFTSPTNYANTQASAYPYDLPRADDEIHQHGEPNRNLIRKEQCSFSWDWGPCFAPIGIWKQIGIIAFSDVFIEHVVPQVFPLNGKPMVPPTNFSVKVDVYLQSATSGIVDVQASVAGKSVTETVTVTPGNNVVELVLNILNPNLWWPRDYGSQNRYQLDVMVQSDSSILASTSKMIGFRSARIVTDPLPGNGSTFYFEVNGIPIFAKGANWIPADSFENRITTESLSSLLQSAYDANMNIVRNWGGGIYQHDWFYEECDRLGLLVWEEFMFACAMYPRDDEFLHNVAEEVIYQIKRLAYHPSIVLWSGNNENEAALHWFPDTIFFRDRYIIDYVKLYFDTIHTHILNVDQSRFFWPSSPSNGWLVQDPYVGIWGDPQSQIMGDVHFYDYGMMCTDIDALPNPRFASEYGFQSLDSFVTFQKISQSQDWTRNSSLMQHRQHHADGIDQLEMEVSMHFKLVPSDGSQQDFENWIYLTQSMQALCIKSETEHYRRSRSMTANTMGAIYWQLNNIWQAPTWSGLEYGGRWKMLHYYVKNMFHKYLVSGYEHPDNLFNIHATSDDVMPVNGNAIVSTISWTGKLASEDTLTFTASPLSSDNIFNAELDTFLLQRGCERETCFIFLQWMNGNNQILSENVFYPTNFTMIQLMNPNIQISSVTMTDTRTANVVLTSKFPAPFTFVTSSCVEGRFSDNGFCLVSAETPSANTKTIQFFGREDFTAQELKSCLSVVSLFDTY